MIEVKPININEVKAFLETLRKAKLDGSKQGVMRAATFVQDEVKASISGQRGEPTSVDTGRFLNSIDVQMIDTLTALVFTDIEYAKFLEYGTSKIEPRYHFGNTVLRIQGAIKEIFEKETE